MSTTTTGTGTVAGTLSLSTTGTNTAATITLDYAAVAGAPAPTPATFTVDDPTLVTAVAGTLSAGGTLAAVQTLNIAVAPGAKPGQTTVRALVNGVDESDLVVIVTAPPVDTVAFDPGSIVYT